MGSVAALTVAFNEPRLIKPCIRQFKEPYAVRDIFHMVMVSDTPWRGVWAPDNTYDIAKEMGADLVCKGDWPNQAIQFNSGLQSLRDLGYEWAIICDADEYYTQYDLEIILSETQHAKDYAAIRTENMDVYWKYPVYRIEPKQRDNPVVAIRTSQFFTDKRSISLSSYDSDVSMHHFSYVRTNEEMKKKIESFEHSHEFDLDKWYKDKWLHGTVNLHPVVPEQFSHYIYKPAPKQILENYNAD